MDSEGREAAFKLYSQVYGSLIKFREKLNKACKYDTYFDEYETLEDIATNISAYVNDARASIYEIENAFLRIFMQDKEAVETFGKQIATAVDHAQKEFNASTKDRMLQLFLSQFLAGTFTVATSNIRLNVVRGDDRSCQAVQFMIDVMDDENGAISHMSLGEIAIALKIYAGCLENIINVILTEYGIDSELWCRRQNTYVAFALDRQDSVGAICA